MTANILRIENNTERLLGLPPTQSFPAGVRLIPGLNTVPAGYMAELDAAEAETHINGKPGPKRFPGRDALALLLKPVKIVKTNGTHRGPQITVFTDEQAGRDDGPPAPEDLKDMKEAAAIKIVAVTNDREALKRWQGNDKRQGVQAAISAKLGG